MSAPLINRSLTTIRTELEFLRDSEVITEQLYDKLLSSIPTKYQKDDKPWGVDKLGISNISNKQETDKLADQLSKTDLNGSINQSQSQTQDHEHVPPPSYPPAPAPTKSVIEFVKVLYDFPPQQKEDLGLNKDDKIAVVEHLSPDWWRGYRKGSDPEKATGVFPSNYVTKISKEDYESNFDTRVAPPAPQGSSLSPYGGPPQQPLSQQPSYGGYSQYPPPSANYYPPQQPQEFQPQPQQQQQPQQQGHGSEMFKKFGSKLGNAAIFGAGATIGSDLVNSIF
ncbi:SH3 domain-containing protein [Scheffersomyces amazonensis]|uniref:SH3 domain-containing protein n=1 Tax=Scheffersomyces amazonensis TaxID=1078765 RepID=UPI00315DAED0